MPRCQRKKSMCYLINTSANSVPSSKKPEKCSKQPTLKPIKTVLRAGTNKSKTLIDFLLMRNSRLLRIRSRS